MAGDTLGVNFFNQLHEPRHKERMVQVGTAAFLNWTYVQDVSEMQKQGIFTSLYDY